MASHGLGCKGSSRFLVEDAMAAFFLLGPITDDSFLLAILWGSVIDTSAGSLQLAVLPVTDTEWYWLPLLDS